MSTTPITCPSCGTVAHLGEIQRDASEFCPKCDYPLFWAQSATVVVGSRGSTDTGLRRLPGTAGRVAIAMIACWSCEEPNPVTGTHCVRCSVDLVPPVVETAPIPVPPPPPPAPEPPPPPKRAIWPWVLLVLLIIATVVVLVVANQN